MNLSHILNDELIMLDVDCNNKSEALTIMAKRLHNCGYVYSADEFLNDVYEREKLGETGIGNYVAIPHGQSDAVIKSTLCIARLKKEIDWESLDGNGVKVIIMFVVENNEDFANRHLKMLAEVARKLANKDRLDKLLNAKTKQEIKECFK